MGAAPAQAMGALHLTKGIVGTGWLSLPAGVASLSAALDGSQSSSSVGITAAMALVLVVGAAAALSYRAVARSAAATGSASFAEAFERSAGGGGAAIVAAVVAANCLGGCVSFAMILGDMTVAQLSLAGISPSAGAEATFRAAAVAAVSGGVLYPACRRLDLRSMEWTSVVGVLSTLLTTGVMAARLLDGSYTSPAGAFFTGLPPEAAVVATPASDTAAPGAVFMFVSLLINSFIAHQGAPKLRKAVDDDMEGCTADRDTAFDVVVGSGFALSSALYAGIAACGYLTFGSACGGNVLDNYAADDMLAGCARLALAACVVCSFPQMLLGLQDGLRDLLGAANAAVGSAGGRLGSCAEALREVCLSPGALISLVALLAAACTDLASVMAANGAILGFLLVFALPYQMAAAGDRGRGARGA